jgi:iron complex transport system permease protein
MAAAAAVSLCGLIGFVGLIAPHTVRLVTGPSHRRLLPAAALAGALLLSSADVLSRLLLPPVEIPVGILTSLAGAPLFLVLLFRRGRRLGGFS